jgi:signal transduction histidine kinase
MKNKKQKRRILKQDDADVFLLIPASSREGFSESVCGLPGYKEGCWRYREAKDKDDIPDKGIRPCGEGQTEDQPDLVAWVIYELPFDRSDDEDALCVRVKQEKPALKPKFHQVFFGFTKDGLDKFRKSKKDEYLQETQDAYFPNHVEYWGWSQDDGEHQDIKNWLWTEDHPLSLSDCFWRLTFIRKRIENPEFRLNNLDYSLSELIREYLNHNPGCRFRRGQNTRGIGITLCKAEIGLSKISAHARGSNLSHACTISFSYTDPDSLNVKPLPEWSIGYKDTKAGTKISDELRDSPEKYFQALPVFNTEQDGINFAMCLSRDGRRFILPSEIGKSFLSFPVGELTAYLLHWLLLRIFADNSEYNAAFVVAFNAWRKALRNDDSNHHSLFATLLEMPVTLPVDKNVFTEKVLELPEEGPSLGIYTKATRFGEALGTLGLGTREDHAWIDPTIEFLIRFFEAETADDNLRALPMYQDLNWRYSELLKNVGKRSKPSVPFMVSRALRWFHLHSKNGSAYSAEHLEAIFACMAEASGLSSPEAAADSLAQHVRRCVFPIAEVLATLPPDNSRPFYYIFPLWEDMINGQRRPIVFAHVFSRALHTRPGSSTSFLPNIFTTGAALQKLLLPAGAAIAHDFYNRERKKIERSDQERRTAWTQARAWAHEVKNYTSPIITDLGHSALGNAQNVSEEARIIIARSRRAMLILNAASKAIQLAISKLANISKADEELEELPCEYAREIVEAVLQYLLNYRVETLNKNLLFKWEPHYSSNQAIEKLSDILRAIRKKLDLQDVERTVLGDKVVIGVIALLREVIGNIRMDSPYETPGVINISYSFINQGNDWLVLDLLQHQVETIEGEELPDEPPGVKMANELLGENCAKFGSIKTIKTESVPRPKGKGFDVRYRVQVKFALSKKSTDKNKEILA